MIKGKSTFTQLEANEIIQLIRMKLLADTNTQKGIRNKIRALGFYAQDFGIGGGYTEHDFLKVATIVGSGATMAEDEKPIAKNIINEKSAIGKRAESDESYILDLCDEILQQKSLRQYRFQFLRGDADTMLPVDAYYPDLETVIEYREKQHTEEVNFFDKRITSTGITRGVQRRKYDELRRNVLPANGIRLIELSYDEFNYRSDKTLIRDRKKDLEVVRNKFAL